MTDSVDPTPASEPAPAVRVRAQFQLLVEDMYDQAWCQTRSLVVFWVIGAVFSVAAILAAPTVLDLPIEGVWALYSLLPFLVLLLGVWRNRRAAGSAFARLTPDLREVTVSMTETHLTSSLGATPAAVWPWSSVHSMQRSKDIFHIFVSPVNTVPVSRRAFSSSQKFEEACAFAWTHACGSRRFPRYGYIVRPILLWIASLALMAVVWQLGGPTVPSRGPQDQRAPAPGSSGTLP